MVCTTAHNSSDKLSQPRLRNCCHRQNVHSDSLFTLLTRTRLSCLCRRSEQDSFVSSRTNFDEFCFVSTQFPISKSSVILNILRLNSCKLETGSRQDKTVLSCLQLCSHRRRNKTRHFCPCWWYEQAMTHCKLKWKFAGRTSQLNGLQK